MYNPHWQRYPLKTLLCKHLHRHTLLQEIPVHRLCWGFAKPNITGEVGTGESRHRAGAFYSISKEYAGSTQMGGSTDPTAGFDASKSMSLYGNSNNVQPLAFQVLMIIKLWKDFGWRVVPDLYREDAFEASIPIPQFVPSWLNAGRLPPRVDAYKAPVGDP